MTEPSEKEVLFWLNRVVEEYLKRIANFADEASVLNYQQRNYSKMADNYKMVVLKSLLEHILYFKWDIPEELKGKVRR